MEKEERNIVDIAKDYRETIKKAIDDGAYDHSPEFKQAAVDHMAAWDKWAETSRKVVTYNPILMILLLPWYLKLNADLGKQYSELQFTQDRLNEIARKVNFERKEAEEEFKDYMNGGNIQ